MGEYSKVEWTHHTQNGWIGCNKVSPECKGCYAEVETFPRVMRAKGIELWGPKAERHVTSDDNWRKPYRWNRAAIEAGERHRVFCYSESDIFERRDGDVGRKLDDARARQWDQIDECTQLDYLLLTKRPENILEMVPEHWRAQLPRNVWVGATAGLNSTMQERWPHLAKVPAVVRFISAEPLLERVDLRCSICWETPEAHVAPDRKSQCIGHFPDWFIMGGGSGREKRSSQIEWFRHLLSQCRIARGVAPFVKQLGTQPLDGTVQLRVKKKGGELDDIPPDLRVREFPPPRAA